MRAARRPWLTGRRASALLTLVIACGFLSGRARAADPIVSVGPSGAKVRIVSASLAEALNALARAAGFEVKYEGTPPAAMLFNLEIDAASVPEALLRLLAGQSLNYGLALDSTGKRVSSLLIGTPAPRTGAPGNPSVPPPPGVAPRPFGNPRNSRAVPIVEENAIEDEAAPEEEPSPTPSPTPAPVPTPPGIRPGQQFPPAMRPPFGQPFGPRPTPSVSPLP